MFETTVNKHLFHDKDEIPSLKPQILYKTDTLASPELK